MRPASVALVSAQRHGRNQGNHTSKVRRLICNLLWKFNVKASGPAVQRACELAECRVHVDLVAARLVCTHRVRCLSQRSRILLRIIGRKGHRGLGTANLKHAGEPDSSSVPVFWRAREAPDVIEPQEDQVERPLWRRASGESAPALCTDGLRPKLLNHRKIR